jgi:hypothetical protein
MRNDFKKQGSIIKIYLRDIHKKCVGVVIADADNDDIIKHTWYLNNSGYAITRINKKKQVLMHRMIMGDKELLDIDHINRNKLDNRLANLRFVNRSQNMMNTDAKGYYWCKEKKKWAAYIHINYKCIPLGRYKTETEAKKAREKGEIKYFGNFKTYVYRPKRKRSFK